MPTLGNSQRDNLMNATNICEENIIHIEEEDTSQIELSSVRFNGLT